MGNILSLTDFSAGANNAAAYALDLARQFESDLILLHVKDSDEEHSSTGVEQQFEELKNKLNQSTGGQDDYQPALVDMVLKGQLKEGIANVLKEKDIDLVIIGATDGANKTGFLFGKRVREIIRSAHYPILLVPSATSFKYVDNVFYVTDIRYANTQAIGRVIGIAELLGADVSVLHVGAAGLPGLPAGDARSLFHDLIVHIPGRTPRFLTPGPGKTPEALIRELLAGQGQDILAVAHREHHFFGHIFMEHATEEAVIYKQIPMLVLPA